MSGAFARVEAASLTWLGAECEVWRHPSGAQHLHLRGDHLPYAWVLALRTPPEDDTGLTHVLEHMVLGGSEAFASDSPFFDMLPRSAALAINAAAKDDTTTFHFVTQEPQDFQNLAAVFFDAAFRPKLSNAAFRREAHRVEPRGDGTLAEVGVVLGEMQGALADPSVAVQWALRRQSVCLFARAIQSRRRSFCYPQTHAHGPRRLPSPNIPSRARVACYGWAQGGAMGTKSVYALFGNDRGGEDAIRRENGGRHDAREGAASLPGSRQRNALVAVGMAAW